MSHQFNMGLEFLNDGNLDLEGGREFAPCHKRTSSMASQAKLLRLMGGGPGDALDAALPPGKVGQISHHHPGLHLALNPSPASSSTFFASESDDDSKQVGTDSDEEFLDETGNYMTPQEMHELNKMHIDHQFLLEQNRTLSRELACAKMTAQALRSIIQQKDEQLVLMTQELPPKSEKAPIPLLSLKFGKPDQPSRIRLPFRLRRLSSASSKS